MAWSRSSGSFRDDLIRLEMDAYRNDLQGVEIAYEAGIDLVVQDGAKDPFAMKCPCAPGKPSVLSGVSPPNWGSTSACQNSVPRSKVTRAVRTRLPPSEQSLLFCADDVEAAAMKVAATAITPKYLL